MAQVTPTNRRSSHFVDITSTSLGEIMMLLQNGWDPDMADEKGRSSLHMAAMRGRFDIMEVLIKHGASVSKRDCHDNTPLHYCGHLESVKCLLEHGSDLSARNSHNDTPLTLMMRKGISEEVLSLLKAHSFSQAGDSRYHRHAPATAIQKIHSIWEEFCHDVGLRNVIIVVSVVFCLSLFIAYLLTGWVYNLDIKTVDIPYEKTEL